MQSDAPPSLPRADGARHEQWPDIAKGIGIICVVFGHAWRGLEGAGMLPPGPLFGMVDRAIYAFHMPLFFFLAGWFFPRTLQRHARGTLSARLLQRLLFPMVLWTYVFLGIQILVGQAANAPIPASALLRWPVPPYLHLWFLWALIVLQLVGIAVRPLAARYPRPAFAILSVLSFWLLFVNFPTDLIYIWFPGLLWVAPFFFLGGLWALYGPIPAARRYLLPALIAFAAVDTVAIFSADSGIAPAFGVALVAVISVLVVARQEQLWSGWVGAGLLLLGQCSMTIYLMHTIFSAMIRIVLQKELGLLHWPPVLAAVVIGGLGLPLLFHIPAVPPRLRRALGVS